MFTNSGQPSADCRPRETARQCSKEALEAIDRHTLLAYTLNAYFRALPGDLTADEATDRVKDMGLNVTILSIRPRVTELKKAGLLAETGNKRKNKTGKNCHALKYVFI